MISYNTKRLFSKGFIYIILGAYSLLVIIPLALIISSSFKMENDILSYPIKWWPKPFVLENFLKLKSNFPTYILNSLKVTIITVILQVITATSSGYAFAKLKWKFRDSLFLLYIASIMIPIQSIIIPQFIIVKSLGLYDTHAGLIITSAFTAFGTFMMKQFFMNVPDSLLEAARIDGASDFGIFFRIMLPLSKGALASLVIFSFRWYWNEFFQALIYITSPKLKTLPLGLSEFVSEYYTYYGPQMAAALISIFPILVVFLFAQKYIVENESATGLKG